MPRYVALLRAVNVGGRTVKMDRLRDVLAELGLSKVETFIASGNVLFDSRASPAALEKKIEAALEAEFGWPVETFIRTREELVKVLAKLPDDTGMEGVYIGFLKTAPTAGAQAALRALGTSDVSFSFGAREFYWLLRVRMNLIRLTPKQMERALGGPATTRNVNTIRKLIEKL